MQGLITVFGGSGFLGRHLIRRLAATGAPIRVAVRDAEAGQFLKPMGDVAQIELAPADVHDGGSVAAALEGTENAVYLVGVLAETSRQKFLALHAEGAERVARASSAAGVKRLVHVSAIGADVSAASRYARTKAEGEMRVRAAFPGATIVRPSVVFGPEDDFFNRFAAMSRWLPFLPIFGGGDGPRFQPVFVGDVAEAMARILAAPDTAGRVYELGGPEILSLRQVYRRVLAGTGRRRPIVPAPFWVGTVMAWKSAVLPFPAALNITRDQLLQLRADNVATPGAKGLADLSVSPTPVAAIVPETLARYRASGGAGAQAAS